jgi:hypothetical protein
MNALRRLALLLLVSGSVVAAQSRAGAQQNPLPPLPPPAIDADSPPPSDPESPVAPPLAPLPPPAPTSTPVASPSSVAGRAAPDDRAPESDAAENAPDSPPTPDPWGSLPLVLEAQFGLGAPLGLVGIALDYSPVPAIGINLGVGLGGAGPQYALSTRLRVFRFGHRAHFAPYVGLGASAGAYNQTEWGLVGGDPPTTVFHWNTAYWMNLETGMEMRFGQHFELRPYAGIGFLLNPDAASPVPANSPPVEPIDSWALYAGIAVGYAFGW